MTLRLVPFRVPLTQRFRRVTAREGVLVQGPAGWSEFSPFDDYGPEYSARWLACAIDAATSPPPAALRTSIEVNTTVPAVDAATAATLVRDATCRTVKVKVAEPGQDLADDVNRVAAVRDALGAAGKIRVDANGAWDVESAVLAITRIERAAGGLEYVEQPCRTVDELAAVRRRVSVLVAADESVRTTNDPARVARAGAADIIVVKVQPMGGVAAALKVVDACGLPAVPSSAVETSIGLAVGCHFAAALPDLAYASGLGTATLLADDVVDPPLRPVDGWLAVEHVAPSEAALQRVCLTGDDARCWLQRMADAAVYGDAVLQGLVDEAIKGYGDD